MNHGRLSWKQLVCASLIVAIVAFASIVLFPSIDVRAEMVGSIRYEIFEKKIDSGGYVSAILVVDPATTRKQLEPFTLEILNRLASKKSGAMIFIATNREDAPTGPFLCTIQRDALTRTWLAKERVKQHPEVNELIGDVWITWAAFGYTAGKSRDNPMSDYQFVREANRIANGLDSLLTGVIPVFQRYYNRELTNKDFDAFMRSRLPASNRFDRETNSLAGQYFPAQFEKYQKLIFGLSTKICYVFQAYQNDEHIDDRTQFKLSLFYDLRDAQEILESIKIEADNLGVSP